MMSEFFGTLRKASQKTRLIIYGAGQCGIIVKNEIQTHKELNYVIVAFIDDNPNKQITTIDDIDVIGKTDIDDSSYEFDEILIAIPSIKSNELKVITEWCRSIEKPFRLIPGYYQLLEKKVYPGIARKVRLEDLLSRGSRDLDTNLLKSFFDDKIVLVTGAGGSIGSELCRQLIQLNPKRLVLIDSSETNLFNIEQDIKELGYKKSISVLGDICDRVFLESIIIKYQPELVFHAAAYKHVPMLESNVCQAVLNNIISTENLLDLSEKYSVSKFVLISTDKAVNPTSVMGATKRVCELLTKQNSRNIPAMIVRFGNVLGSSGSLIPIIRKRILRKLPVEITDRKMRRYFMSIPEASSLVLHVGAKGKSGSVYVLDMGKDYSVLDIIKQVIKLEGLEPGKDIQIIEKGLRPGEKIIEELSSTPEHLIPTDHPSVNIDVNDPFPDSDFQADVKKLIKAAEKYNEEEVKELLHQLVMLN